MLLAAIDERHRGTYDFIYLPIDFKASEFLPQMHFYSSGTFFFLFCCVRVWQVLSAPGIVTEVELRNNYCLSLLLQNKCNVGYAFINMTDPSLIIPFYQVCFINAAWRMLFVFYFFCYIFKFHPILVIACNLEGIKLIEKKTFFSSGI